VQEHQIKVSTVLHQLQMMAVVAVVQDLLLPGA
jgi:hypothetical protein